MSAGKMKGKVLWFDDHCGIIEDIPSRELVAFDVSWCQGSDKTYAEGELVRYDLGTFKSSTGGDYRCAEQVYHDAASGAKKVISAPVVYTPTLAHTMTLPYKPGHALVGLITRARTYDQRYVAYTGKVLSDLFIDRLYGRMELPNEGKNVRIIVASFICAGGRGDLTLGLKVATLLKEILPSQVEIALVVPPDDPNNANLSHEKTMCAIIDHEGTALGTSTVHNGVAMFTTKTLKKKKKWKSPTVVIGAPGQQCYAKIKDDITSDPSFYYIGEAAFSHNYSGDAPRDKNCVGFKSHELGVILQSIPSKGVADLSRNAAELKDLLLGGESKYPTNKRLYFGYAHAKDSLKGFIRTVVALELLYKKGGKAVKSVDICLPAHKLGSELDEIKAWLKQIPGVFLHLYWRGGDDPETIQVSDGNKGPNDVAIRIVQLPFLSHPDFLTMLTASEPMNLCTGDQSLIESMCAGKLIMYDTPAHKIALYADVIAMSEVKKSKEATALLKKLVTSGVHKNADDFQGPGTKYFQDVAKLMLTKDGKSYRPKLLEYFESLPQELEEFYGIDNQLRSKVFRLVNDWKLKSCSKPIASTIREAIRAKEDRITALVKSPLDAASVRLGLVCELEKLYQLIHQRHCKVRVGGVVVDDDHFNAGRKYALIVPKRMNMELDVAFRGGVEANALAAGILKVLKELLGDPIKLSRFGNELKKEKTRFCKGITAYGAKYLKDKEANKAGIDSDGNFYNKNGKYAVAFLNHILHLNLYDLTATLDLVFRLQELTHLGDAVEDRSKSPDEFLSFFKNFAFLCEYSGVVSLPAMQEINQYVYDLEELDKLEITRIQTKKVKKVKKTNPKTEARRGSVKAVPTKKKKVKKRRGSAGL